MLVRRRYLVIFGKKIDFLTENFLKKTSKKTKFRRRAKFFEPTVVVLVIPAVALVFPIRDAGNEEVLTVGTLVVVCIVAASTAAAACLLAFDTNFFGGLLLVSCCSDVLCDSLSEDAAMPEPFLAE